MAALMKAMHISKYVNNVTKLMTSLHLSPNISPISSVVHNPRISCALLHTSSTKNDLMEFFDNKKNWGKDTIKVGRSWKKDELRLKSNEDLHKLWYVLLKERNMLMTMDEACKNAQQIFPNPERVDKVEESMSNLESVVRERNRAYHLLETGETGERPGKLVYNAIGLKYFHRMHQYSVPKFMNKRWHKEHIFAFGGYAVQKFLRLYREKLWNARRRERTRQKNRVIALMRKFPNLDMEAIKEQYPTVDIEKVRNLNKARGHFEPQ